MAGDLLLLFLIGWATALATGLGAIPVFVLGARVARFTEALTGFAAGLMAVAAIVGLLEPALDSGSRAAVAGSLALGVAFLLVTGEAMRRRDARVAAERALGASARRSLLVILVLFVHSIPEGLAIGTAFASDEAGLGLFVILAITLQNVPEGTATALPMQEAGYSAGRQFWAAVLTSVPQPFAAVGAYVLVEQVSALLPASFAFAAGAMLALVVVDLVPHAFTRARWPSAVAGTAIGAGLMLALSAALGV
jgi:ZIP family zinc transporter